MAESVIIHRCEWRPHNKEGFGSTKAGPEGAVFIKTKKKKEREKEKEKRKKTRLNTPYESLSHVRLCQPVCSKCE